MRSVLPALMLGSIVTLFSGGGFAHADQGARSLAPVREQRSSTAPNAGELLRLMRAAVMKQGSVHVDFHMASGLYPAGRTTTHLLGDVSWKFNLLHDRTVVQRTDVGHAGQAPVASIDLLFVHQRAASHNRSGGWQCQNLTNVRVMSTLLGLQETVLSAATAGAATANGVPVWEVLATGYSPVTGSITVAHVRYDISQQDYTLQRVEVTGTVTYSGRTQPIVATEEYTHYGETVNVRLPAACSAP